jgi:hypothetical protein
MDNMTERDRKMDFHKGGSDINAMMIVTSPTSTSAPKQTEPGDRNEKVVSKVIVEKQRDVRAPVSLTPLPRLADHRIVRVPPSLKSPERPKTKTSACLVKDFPEVDGLCFQNMAEAKAQMDLAQWHAPEIDPSFPQTDAEHREYVRMLVDAFKDMRTAKDTATNAYRKRLTPGEAVYYKNWAIEACAWDIVAMAKAIHTDGFKIPIYDKAIIDSIGQTQKWMFSDRMDWICEVLRTSKHVGVTLMKHEKNWTTIGAPQRLYSSTLVNCISNAHRGRWIKDGRSHDQAHQDREIRGRRTAAEMTGAQGEGTGVDKVTKEPPRKRQKVKHMGSADRDAIVGDSKVDASPVKKAKVKKHSPTKEKGNTKDELSSDSSELSDVTEDLGSDAADAAGADALSSLSNGS